MSEESETWCKVSLTKSEIELIISNLHIMEMYWRQRGHQSRLSLNYEKAKQEYTKSIELQAVQNLLEAAGKLRGW